MTTCERRLAAVLFLFALATRPMGAQIARLAAGGGAGGTVFGWQPRVAVSGDIGALSLGTVDASFHAALARTTAASNSLLELAGGGRVSLGRELGGWWLGGTAVRRDGFRDAVERPRIETGGWRRFGSVVITISAARRSSRFTRLNHMTRQVEGWQEYFDTIGGYWDSVRVERTVGDSTRVTTADRWAESEAGLTWERDRLSAAFTVGGRLPSRNVPKTAWASAVIALKLADPLSVVLGAGSAAGSHFALDAEHRFLSLGFRIMPRFRHDSTVEHSVGPAPRLMSFRVDRDGDNYRLIVTAPRARRVELSGDFSAWRPLPLTSSGDGRWTVVLPLTPGEHRLNVRVNDGSWVAPPGLTTMSDDFAGEVGVLVIERENASR